MTDVANLTLYDRRTHEACVHLEPENYLEHGLTYFTTVWAYNGGLHQKYINSISNGGMYYTLNWVQRLLCMVSVFGDLVDCLVPPWATLIDQPSFTFDFQPNFISKLLYCIPAYFLLLVTISILMS